VRALFRTIVLYTFAGDDVAKYIKNPIKKDISITCMKNHTKENIPRYHSNTIAISAKNPRMI
jgi:hypothetical protein